MLHRKIRIENIVDVLFCIYLSMSLLSERTILGQLSLTLFIASCIFLVLIHGKIQLSFYFLLEFLFIGYFFSKSLLGIAADQNANMDMVATLLLCTVTYICVYNYAVLRKNYHHILKLFCLSYIWSLLVNLLIDAPTLFTTRSGAGLSIGEITIGGAISISVGWMAGVCMVLSVVLYKNNQKKQFWLTFASLTLVLVSAGTRKAFLFVPIALFGWFYFVQHRRNVLKLMVYILIVMLLSIAGYYVVVTNEVLYFAVGHRLENIVKYIFEGSVVNDASLLTRLSLIERAKNAFQERPLTGWGLDSFSNVFNYGGYYAHNNFLEILVSGGWIGFIIYYLKYVYVMASLWSCRKYTGKKNGTILVLLSLAFGLIILEYWQVTYYTRKFMLVWIMLLIYPQSIKRAAKLREKNQIKGASRC